MSSAKKFPTTAQQWRKFSPVTEAIVDFLGVTRLLLGNIQPIDYLMGRRFTFALNFAPWKKRFLQRMYPDHRFVFIPNMWRDRFIGPLFRFLKVEAVFIWGIKTGETVDKLAQQHGVQVFHFEDGFIRSIGLGGNHVPPMSLCIDTAGMHYDCRNESGLDAILAGYDFDADTTLMHDARQCLELVRRNNISKYNLHGRPDDTLASGDKVQRILCVGQVEDDQSIAFGCYKPISNNDLISQAATENPDAEILYKIHPDYAAGLRKPTSDLSEVAHLCTVVHDDVSLSSLFATVDRVYAITSLSGFEALIHGKPVTTLGMPFYAGWGLTDDRHPVPAWRGRKLGLDQLFAGSYIKYPTYFEPETMEQSTLRATVERIVEMRQSQMWPPNEMRPHTPAERAAAAATAAKQSVAVPASLSKRRATSTARPGSMTAAPAKARGGA